MSPVMNLLNRSRLEDELETALAAGHDREAEHLLRALIVEDPLCPAYFEKWSQLQARLGNLNAATLARKRYEQLLQIQENTKVCPSVDRLNTLLAIQEGCHGTLEISGFSFAAFRKCAFRGSALWVACSACGRAFLKVCAESSQIEAFQQETAVFKILTNAKCVSAPALLDVGELPKGWMDKQPAAEYQILSYHRADRGGFGYPDLVLSLLEQQAAGIFVGAITIRNLRYDSIDRVCRFANYESAIRLNKTEQNLPPLKYLEWCAGKERERTSSGGAPSFFLSGLKSHDWIWKSDRLLLRATQLMHDVRRARIPENCLQLVDTPSLSLPIGIDCQFQLDALYKAGLPENCSILEVGCGLGQISRKLGLKGYRVTGVDDDRQQILAARMISKVNHASPDFLQADLDYEALQGRWDITLLLNVFQHFTKPQEAAQRIEAVCKGPIYLEAALQATGFKWQGRWYRRRTAWQCEAETNLKQLFEGWFSQFTFVGKGIDTIEGRKLYCLKRKAAV